MSNPSTFKNKSSTKANAERKPLQVAALKSPLWKKGFSLDYSTPCGGGIICIGNGSSGAMGISIANGSEVWSLRIGRERNSPFFNCHGLIFICQAKGGWIICDAGSGEIIGRLPDGSNSPRQAALR